MKEINIRLKTMEQIQEDSHDLPYIITIDGEVQHDLKRFAINLVDDHSNYENFSYTIEKYMGFDI